MTDHRRCSFTALKYHPDRNPGKEIEFNSKFQAIQAAHEILVDPTQRLKYDTDRLRAGYGKFYGPPKPNNIPRKQPYTPPKTQNRKPAYSGRPTSFQNANTNASAPGGGGAGGPGGGGGGAQRYASYAKAAPHQSWQKTQDHGQTRADAFRGFQDMKGSGAGGMPGWNQFDPRTGRTGQSRPNDGQSQSARPKSAYEYFKSAYNMPKPDPARRKHGFAPRTAGGDEPMAPNTSAYTSTPRENNRWSDYFESVPPPTARKPTAAETAQAQAQAQTQPQPQGDRFGSFAERASSRYATAGGEKTFFSSAGLGRSATVRDPPQRSRSPSRGFPSNADSSTGRHRSASPKVKRESTSSTSSSDMDEERPPFQPKIPKSKLRPNQKYSDFRTRQDRRSGNGELSSTVPCRQ